MENGLSEGTKRFALAITGMFTALRKTAEAQVISFSIHASYF
jgi:hypothetical protein